MRPGTERGRHGFAVFASMLLALTLAAGLVPLSAPVAAVEPGEPSLVWTTELYRQSGYNMHFGQDIAIEGDIMVVGGATGDDNYPGTCGEGLAYVYQRDSALEWHEIAQLTQAAPFACRTENQAYSVAIHGDWIALGAPTMPVLFWDADPVDPQFPDDYNASQGAVLLYHKPAGGWQSATETMLLTEYDGSPSGEFGDFSDNYGADVAFDGSDLVVGAPMVDHASVKDSGAVFVYREWLGGWELSGTLAIADAPQNLGFGASVDASDGVVAVGTHAPFYAGQSLGASAAWLFERPVDGWADSEEPTSTFGIVGGETYEVAIDGPTLLATSPMARRAFVVEADAGGWPTLLAASAELDLPTVLYDQYSDVIYGNDVQGDTIVIGAQFAEHEAGEAYVYQRPADGWGQPGDDAIVQASQVLRSPDPNGADGVTTGDWFGWSVAVDDGIVAVGAYSRWHRTFDTGETNILAGSVFLFEASTDHDAPLTSLVFEPEAPTGLDGWYDEPLSLAVEAVDGQTGVGQVRCALVTGGTFATYDALPPGPCPYLGGASVPEGEWILYAASVDAAGNRSPVISRVVKVDTTDPTPVIELDPATPTGPDGAWLPPLYVKVDSIEEGIVRASGWCTLDPPVAPTTYEELRAMPFCGNDFWTGTGREYLFDETHTLWVGAIDRAGNTSELISRTFSVVRRPQVTIGLSSAVPPTAGWYRGPVTVTVTGTSASGAPAPETRCVLDPASAPLDFVDLPASCPFLGGGLVSTSGSHVVYAGSHDAGGWSPIGSATFQIDSTAPTLTCQGTGPALFVVGASEGALTATVSDTASGPASPTVTLDLTEADLATVGSKTATLRALDVAGNEGTVACAYTVGYGIEIVSPDPGAAFKAGTTVPLTFQLVDADGAPITDAAAASLLGARKSPCRIAISLDGSMLRGCPMYAAATDLFSFGVKTPKSRSAIGIHDIGVEVRASDGRTVLSFVQRVFLLT